MDALAQLLTILSVLSGLYLGLAYLCALIERLPLYARGRVHRSRTQRTQRRVRTTRPRRRRESLGELAHLPRPLAR